MPHQVIIEFVAAATRPIRGHTILAHRDALREAEEFLSQFTILYPNEAIVRNAIRGCAAYELNWFDAHIWAYANTMVWRRSLAKICNTTGFMAPYAQ